MGADWDSQTYYRYYRRAGYKKNGTPRYRRLKGPTHKQTDPYHSHPDPHAERVASGSCWFPPKKRVFIGRDGIIIRGMYEGFNEYLPAWIVANPDDVMIIQDMIFTPHY